jgi:hypothetical protein
MGIAFTGRLRRSVNREETLRGRMEDVRRLAESTGRY